MPHFLLTSGPSGPLMDIYITVSATRQQILKNQAQPVPPPVLARALIDTGASHTVIDNSIVAALGLIPTGVVQVLTPSTGTTPCEQFTYDVGVYVPMPDPKLMPWPFPLWVVSAADLQHQGFTV